MELDKNLVKIIEDASSICSKLERLRNLERALRATSPNLYFALCGNPENLPESVNTAAVNAALEQVALEKQRLVDEFNALLPNLMARPADQP